MCIRDSDLVKRSTQNKTRSTSLMGSLMGAPKEAKVIDADAARVFAVNVVSRYGVGPDFNNDGVISSSENVALRHLISAIPFSRDESISPEERLVRYYNVVLSIPDADAARDRPSFIRPFNVVPRATKGCRTVEAPSRGAHSLSLSLSSEALKRWSPTTLERGVI